MTSTLYSVCSRLRLYPLGSIDAYSRSRRGVLMRVVSDPIEVGETPGTLLTASTSTGGYFKKKISYEPTDTSADALSTLEIYKTLRWVAVYTDERGRLRVCGTPVYPLALDYTAEDGTIKVTLEGEDICADLFLL